MDFGDIISLILLVFFLILGFFNDSKKKKQQQKQPPQQPASRPFLEVLRGDGAEAKGFPKPKTISQQRIPPLPPVADPQPVMRPDVRREFRSSSELVSIHDEQPSDPSLIFDYDRNSFYEKDLNSPEFSEDAKEEITKGLSHPLIKDLRTSAGREELKKGLIYGEIIMRKY